MRQRKNPSSFRSGDDSCPGSNRRLRPTPRPHSDLRPMERKDEVLAAEMKIETRAQEFHAHRTALDMPSRASFAPWTRPEHVTVLGRASFPEGEIRDRFLFVFIAAHTLANAHFIKVQFDQ